MRRGHWDAGFGFAGDMALGALLDAGARLESVNAALEVLGVPGLRVEAARDIRCGLDCARAIVRWDGDGAGHSHADPAAGQPALSAHVEAGGGQDDSRGPRAHEHAHGAGPADQAPASHGHRHGHDHAHPSASPAAHPHAAHGHGHHAHRAYRDIRALLAHAPLGEGVRARAEAIFARLAEAEARIHGTSAENVHFHEVGGEDAIGDVVGVAAALDDLGITDLTSSPLPAGGGTVAAAHGLLPVPAPAVALLLSGFDWRPGPVEAELVTPTGAAILAALARPARSWPEFRLEGSGWGGGRREFAGHPNACRFVWGRASAELDGLRSEILTEIETNIDDQTPEAIGHLYDQLFAAGALDVATTPLWMKKQRPGVRLWALAQPAQADRVARRILEESSALGLRMHEVRRWSLPRATETVPTRFGPLRIKVARLDGRVINAAPEYEDCRTAAQAHQAPLKAVFAAAVAAWETRTASGGRS